ncbi:DUF5011 domain-containing protein, partial [Candidatus Woesearchaeota archaeon]|nr:DUF5011 domain-containing protein [Candidatus Woesearchaeota archaeon]
MSSITTITTQFFKNVFKKAIIIVASFAYLFFVQGSALAATQTYTSNGTFTVPVGVNQLTVSMSGAGGGGGALSNSGGGASGGASSIGALLTAAGGNGGRNGSADIGGGAGGLAGGTGGLNGSNGTDLGYGGNGGDSLFGTGGPRNSSKFTNASNGTGYGAGGGGGFDGGGGGGAQAFSSTTISVTPGQVLPITVGAGGTRSTGDGAMAFGGNGAPGFVQISYVLDTTAPVITLLGSTPVTVNYGTAYVDAGATAVDNIDGNRTSNIVTVNSVNVNALGTYTITYNVSDTSGNAATQVTRTVNVVDTVAPVITILGANPVTVAQGSVYTDAGATALDNVNGVRPVTTTGTVNTAVVGVYTIAYTASDLSSNTATATRTVNVTDQTAPTATVAYSTTAPTNGNVTATMTPSESVTITNNGGLSSYTFTANGSFTFNLTDTAGNTGSVTATVSNIDKIVPVITITPYTLTPTNQDIVVTASTNEGTLNASSTTFTVNGSFNFVATDTAGNVSTSTVIITNIDKIIPVITLFGIDPVTVAYSSVYNDAGAAAFDNIGGDITSSIIVANPVNTNISGTYTMSYSVSDSAGNAAIQVTRTVNVVDTAPPVITILGSNPESVVINTAYIDAGATAFDNADATTTVATTSTVDTSILGADTVTYVSTDSSANTATSTRVVNVIAVPDTAAPVITILGANPLTIEGGAVYVDAGATALDNVDGDITANIVATSTVNTAVIGTYTVTYNVSDSSGNNATQVTRTVNVADTTAPVITIVGSNPASVVANSVYTELGATALDNVNGVRPVTTIGAVDTSVIGAYILTYISSDLSGNISTANRTVNVVAADSLSQVTITNSTIGGIFYASYTPTIASGAALGITGTSTITNSTINAPWNLTDVNFNGVTLTNATVAQTNVASSTIINANLTACTITNSFVKNYFAIGCAVTDSIVDPVGGLNDLTGTTVSGNSQIYYSDVTYSTVVSSYIATSTISYSTLANATSTDSTIATSTITGSTIDLSALTFADVTGSTVTASSTITSSTVATSTVSGSTISDSTSITNSNIVDATVASSTLNNVTVLGTGSTITNSTLSNTTVTDAVIVNDIMSSGTIVLPDGTPMLVSTSTQLSSLVNYAPVASFGTAVNNLNLAITDTSIDPNSSAVFTDSWTYNWDFGDSAASTLATTTIGNNNQAHTYVSAGSYTVSLTITDQYGLSSATSSLVTVNAPIVPDTTAPVIVILGNNPETVTQGSVYTDAGATAFDNIDLDI